MSKQHTNAFLLLMLLVAPACRDPLPCDDCDSVAEEADHAEDPPADLPCGGADLETDNDNCGTCGNECPVWLEDTPWEAGTCQAGECGPTWTQCLDRSLFVANCEEFCVDFGRTCVAGGCSGFTALLYDVNATNVCELDDPPNLTMSGACTDPIPWEQTIEWNRFAMCCCE